LHAGGVVAGPEKNERDERGGEAGGEGEKQDPLVEAEAGLWPAGAPRPGQFPCGDIGALNRHIGDLTTR